MTEGVTGCAPFDCVLPEPVLRLHILALSITIYSHRYELSCAGATYSCVGGIHIVIAHLFHDLYLSFSLPFPTPLPNFLTFILILYAHDQRQDNKMQ